MAEFKERLEQALTMRNIKPAELSKITGIGEGAISQYRKGSYKASQRNLEKISSALRVSIPWLMGVSNEPLSVSDNSLNKVNNIPQGFSPMPEIIEVPLIGQIACGQPILAEENVVGRVGAIASWGADFALECKGDSMAPKILDGDIVAIKKLPMVDNGQIAAVRVDNEATLKKVYLYPDRLELRPINPDYDPIVLYGEEMNCATVEGLAVGLCRGI